LTGFETTYKELKLDLQDSKSSFPSVF